MSRSMSQSAESQSTESQVTDPILSDADRAFWQEHGYLVVPDVVPPELCAAAREAIMRYLGLDPAAPVEAHYDRLLPDDREGFVNMLQAQALWDTRQWPRVHQLFTELLGTERLWVSIDQAHMKLPYRQETADDGSVRTWGDGGIYAGPGDPRNHHGGLHWDVAGGGEQDETVRARKAAGKTTGGLCAGTALPDMLHFGDGHPCPPQGVLYLNDRDADGGGFRCVPGFHRRFDDWLASLPDDRSLESSDGGQWIVNHPELEGLFAEAQTIPATEGSLVLWHRLLPHINGRNLSTTPRFAQYITMEEPPTDPQEYDSARAQRIAAWEKSTAQQQPLSDNERQARQQRWDRDHPPAQLTRLGEKLLGLVPWD
jgi:hypothetical protein